MKRSELRKIIKEEYVKILSEAFGDPIEDLSDPALASVRLGRCLAGVACDPPMGNP